MSTGSSPYESLRNLQQSLHELVTSESEAARQSHRKLWALPIAEREKKGKCLPGLRFVRRYDNNIAIFSFSQNESDFREDDKLCLSRGNPALGNIQTSIYRETLDEIHLEISSAFEFDPDEEWVLDQTFIDLESLYLDAIHDLGATDTGRSRILPLLNGDFQSNVDLEMFDESCDTASAGGFNDPQAEAIALAVATDIGCLIQGPPGTGKTRCLAEVVRQLAANGERVLVTTSTHRAIHNALNAIKTADPPLPIAKIGKKIYDPDLRVEQFEDFFQTPFAHSGSGFIIGATPFATRSQRLKNIEFDTIIFDEASQVTLPLAIMGMLAGQRYIFFGDDKQLPPILQSVETADAHHYSIFGRLRNKCPEELLSITYRLNQELTRWPSETFYNSQLIPHSNNADRRLPLQSTPGKYPELLDPATPSIYLEMPPGDRRTFCGEQSLLVAELIEELTKSGLSPADIGIVTPFRRQAREIRRLLRARNLIPAEQLSQCIIDTVERMQGQEREIVICSTPSSDPEFILSLRQFLFQPQRLNVTATRARSKFILIASKSLLSTEALDSDFHELQEIFRSLRDASKLIHWETPSSEISRSNPADGITDRNSAAAFENKIRKN